MKIKFQSGFCYKLLLLYILTIYIKCDIPKQKSFESRILAETPVEHSVQDFLAGTRTTRAFTLLVLYIKY